MISACVALAALALSATGPAFGALSPAAMPDDGVAVVAEGGYSQLRLKYRQGLGSAELGVEGEYDSLRNLMRGMATFRTPLMASRDAIVSADVKVGAFRIFDARASDPSLAISNGLALEFGSSFSYVTEWPVAVFAQIKVPLEAPFTKLGETRLRLMFGAGAEVGLTDELYVSLSGAVGPEFMQGRDPRTAAEAMLGFGWRIF